MPKVPFELTYITYNQEDGTLGWIIALMSLAPILLLCMICSSILLHRDMHSVFLLLEMLSCTLFNQILKRIIKQERPTNGGVQTSHGMPSDHSQFMSCLVIYLTLWLWNNVTLHSRVQKGMSIFALWIIWGFVVYSRIYLGEHSFAQVAVGVVVGFLYGILWYVLDTIFFRHYYAIIADLPLFRWFQFKDYSNIVNVLEMEWQMVQDNSRCLKRD